MGRRDGRRIVERAARVLLSRRREGSEEVKTEKRDATRQVILSGGSQKG
jgi:chorismate synthase